MLAKSKENKAAAYAGFAELLVAEPALPPRPALTVAGLVGAFKAHRKERIKPTTLASYNSVLSPLLEHLADQPAIDVPSTALEDWARQ